MPSVFDVNYVKDNYVYDAITNFLCVHWAIPLDLLVLYIAFSKRNDNSATWFSTAGMILCNLIGTICLCSIYLLYLISWLWIIPMTILFCSVWRQIAQQALVTMQMCILIVAVDRFLTIKCNYHLSRKMIVIAYVLLYTYTEILSILAIVLFGHISDDDICGPTLSFPYSFAQYQRDIALTAIILALIIYVLILHHIRANNTEVPKWLWIIINGLTCTGFSSTPMVTLIFIKQCREEIRHLLRRILFSNHVADEASMPSAPGRSTTHGNWIR
ncbi:unnamed protein product [Thelazia callipaeda]|uniref:G_PROTEIN_RECEP_F1_2 domain-containing protein n=1 Tax=Thelazia callipaeda TaxID=103827 RepID=A0A0N5D3N6_THECL|nr:unnamed protein product [Thelazia callipaeda]